MKKNKNANVSGSKTEFPLHRNISSGVGVTADFDTNDPFESESSYAGNSVDEHVTMEEANEYIGYKQISQINNNL